MKIKIHVDASAAIGIIQRRGLGKLRHVEVHELWMQDALRSGRLSVDKIDGKKNKADAGTKPLDEKKLMVHMHELDYEFVNTESR